MSKIRVMALTVAALVIGVGSAQAVETFEGKKGIGFAQAIGGPQGLAFNFGMGNLAIEGILGISQQGVKDGEGSLSVGLGAGVHFAVLRSENAAFTAGGRLNVGIGKNPETGAKGTKQESVTQIGIDVPLRVYWFADKHFSLHMEFGLAYAMHAKEGDVFGGNRVGAEGTDIVVLGDPRGGKSTFGNIGATFWW